jgi:predicted O-methyltransferase YrrM
LSKGALNVIRRLLAHGLSRLPKGLFTDREFFPIYEQRGIHITPAHFYYPVPVLSELDESIWMTESEMVGIDMNLGGQESLVEDLAKNYFHEYFALNADRLSPPGVYSRNVGYGGTDGAMLYSIIRLRKPRRIIEIGSGSSTLLAIIAAQKNQEEGAPACHITSIEPYPAPYLRGALAGSGEILQQRVETVSLDHFMSLDENDILFIDSSHTVRVGGDVVFEINEVLPRLRKGVVVHIHDICFPLNYSQKFVVEMHCFWAEQYLLQAFLAFNPKYRVLWSFSYVQLKRQDILRKHFSNYYRPGTGEMGAFWMEAVA